MNAVHQVKAYLEWCEYVKRMTPATIHTKKKALERFLKVVLIDDFTTLTNYQFDTWRAELAKQGRSGKTINNYADHIVCCVRWLNIYTKLEVSLDFNIIVRAEEDDPEIIIYSEEEIACALRHCQGLRGQLLISLAYQSGLRLSEMATLKVENIDGLAISIKGKKRKRRRTFIREDTKTLLDKWLLLNDISEGYVFPSPVKWDGRLTNQQITTILQGIFERAGVKKRVHPHAFRHTWFTEMLDNGAPLMDTMIMGGHSNPKTTARYYHASPKRHAEIHAQFIPKASELNKKRPVDKRAQELL